MPSIVKFLVAAPIVSGDTCWDVRPTSDDIENASAGSKLENLKNLVDSKSGDRCFREYSTTTDSEPKQFTDCLGVYAWKSDQSKANAVGGLTIFQNLKGSAAKEKFSASDILTIPDHYFMTVNNAKYGDSDYDFPSCPNDELIQLFEAMVESGSEACMNNMGKDTDGSDKSCRPNADKGIEVCFHLLGHTTVDWMHMHAFQLVDYVNADDLHPGSAVCTDICNGRDAQCDWASYKTQNPDWAKAAAQNIANQVPSINVAFPFVV